MRPYAQYCPVVRAVEILGDRWTLLIVRDMLVGATRFNELARGLPGLSRALLSRRLRQLQHDGLVERTGDGYTLTRAGTSCARSCSASPTGARGTRSATRAPRSSTRRC